ncbi:MAG TPA: 4a-hydroxytetrahydrobiopterin dehydratase [Candidatus Eremiobacteraceae bacterium]|nr:4a-hydroxytetrahydrobiopterin dehydratase [Candidatus Eremiobacteraceae bacterium]
MDLAEKACVPCRGGVPPLPLQQSEALLQQLDGWELVENHHLRKSFKFPDFKSALDFVDRVGALAEEQQHHPDITLSWGRAVVEIWTHKINGLTESDFVFAAKCDRLR